LEVEEMMSGAKIRALVALLAALFTAASWSAASAHKYKYRQLYAFCSEANCADGGEPLAGLVMDSAHNLYGVTTYKGGSGQDSAGTVFKLSPNGKKWKHRTLYSFCSQANCTDGLGPQGTLILDTKGNLYGTAAGGGANGAGAVFKLTPSGTRWKFKVIYNFCSQGGSACTDGRTPDAGLTYAGAADGALYDGTSALYGTTINAGSDRGNFGTAYKLIPHNNRERETTLYAFCQLSNCSDGASPRAGVTLDSAGNVFGTTSNGGSDWDKAGTVYQLSSGGGETVLYQFCPAGNCPDGAYPLAPLLLSAGTLTGTTSSGGANETGQDGTIFSVDANGEHVLYSFCALSDCADGRAPAAGLVKDPSGNLIGTTSSGGNANGGVVYAFDGSNETVLHAFCASCGEGWEPESNVILDDERNIYGVTLGGGTNFGTVYELEY
jgi:uncharacterized repeat protein (TIGR03803 family)